MPPPLERLIEKFDSSVRTAHKAARPCRGSAGAKRLPIHGNRRQISRFPVRSDLFRWPPSEGRVRSRDRTSDGTVDRFVRLAQVQRDLEVRWCLLIRQWQGK